MTQLTEILPGKYCIEVPMDAGFFVIESSKDGAVLAFDPDENSQQGGWGHILLPPGIWSIICCSRTATEEEAAKVVEPRLYPMTNDIMGYTDYCDRDELFDNPDQSLRSLIRSKGLDDKKNYVILKLEI